MDGIINILKPPGMTSHDVVSYIRRTLKISKVGHTGTLDPGVPGVLPICIGKATRIAEFISNRSKSYRGIIKFGINTTTQDKFGDIISTTDAANISVASIQEAFLRFTGQIEQIPPMVSAVKVKGKKLYQLARQGIEIRREPRVIIIYSLVLKRYINNNSSHPEVMFDVTCSKGTYIRTLCYDIGQQLGCGAHMSYLIRTASGTYDLGSAFTLEEISKSTQTDNISTLLQPIDSALSSFPIVIVRESAVKSVINGGKLYPQGVHSTQGDICAGQYVRMKNENEDLLAIGQVYTEENENCARSVFRPVKVFLSDS